MSYVLHVSCLCGRADPCHVLLLLLLLPLLLLPLGAGPERK
jgi:hypothetical protein